ncbi:hypothetical protein PGAL8A_00250000 [Plasmodium gallinaceum]|uniref:SNARE protein n=1 Tax=Plasmodium gallinaceum TaxID=5849 RepID=A0A1J1GS17_PLAGA|nr:hypothetical protein PGAL8A_00250000 [Plasmodium gallinaceum]CRG95100.1 hypothetical protein PGAL8A_00250000 [Plasmodium gallinaceum]
MEDFKIIYASIIKFKDKIPIFTYYTNIESELRVELVRSLNLFSQSSSIGAFPDSLPFEHGIIYSLYNKNLTLIYIIITKKGEMTDKHAFSFLEECMNKLENNIDYKNLHRLPKNYYSRSFANFYQNLIKKYNAEYLNNYERFDKKIVRILSTIHKGIESSLKNKNNLSKLERRLSSLAINAKIVCFK